MDAGYGDMPAHDGPGQGAQETADDLLGRLAIAPLVLEGRGLDVTPAMIDQLVAVADPESAATFTVTMNDEIGLVAIGKNGFTMPSRRSREIPSVPGISLPAPSSRGR